MAVGRAKRAGLEVALSNQVDTYAFFKKVILRLRGKRAQRAAPIFEPANLKRVFLRPVALAFFTRF